MGDLPVSSGRSDVTVNNYFDCGNSIESVEASPVQLGPIEERDSELLEAFLKLWAMELDPPDDASIITEEAKKLEIQFPHLVAKATSTSSSTGRSKPWWSFLDLSSPQVPSLTSPSLSLLSSNGNQSNGSSTTQSSSDEDDPSTSTPVAAVTTVTTVEKVIDSHKIGRGETGLVPVPGNLKLKLTPEKNYRVYPLRTACTVGWESVFCVEEDQNNSNQPGEAAVKSWLFKVKIELVRPDDSTELLSLRPHVKASSPAQPQQQRGRYFCSFVPKETGKHLLCVTIDCGTNSGIPDRRPIQGSPMFVSPCRFYLSSTNVNVVRKGFASQVPFCSKAWGIAVHRPNNMIYLADREQHEVLILDSRGNLVKKFGSQGAGPGQVYRPTGVAVDAAHGRVVITDKDNHRVSIFDLEGNFLFSFGQKGHHNGQFQFPWGVAVSPGGQFIVVADSRNHRIQLFDSRGTFLRKFSVFESRPFEYTDEFNYPRGVAFSLDGTRIYVTDFNIHAVFAFDLDLTLKETLVGKGPLSRPQGLTVDEVGNVIIADSKNNCIRIVSPTGNLICFLHGSGKDRFESPMDVAVLRGGHVVVVDKERRLRIF